MGRVSIISKSQYIPTDTNPQKSPQQHLRLSLRMGQVRSRRVFFSLRENRAPHR